MTDPLLIEAYNKHISESQSSHSSNNTEATASSNVDPSKPGFSILGSPPRALAPLAKKTESAGSENRPPSLMSLMSVKVPANDSSTKSISPQQAQHPSSPPGTAYQNITYKKTLLATPIDVIPSLHHNNDILPSAFGGVAPNQDIDERAPVEPSISLNIAPSIIQTGDIDERSIPAKVEAPTELADPHTAEALKQELIVKIMKAIADGDNGIEGDNALAKLPKQTLTELLVKLLNDKDNQFGPDVILNLLATLGSSTSAVDETNSHGDNDSRVFVMDDGERSLLRDSFNESMSNNLQIDLNGGGSAKKSGTRNGSRSRRDHDDPYSDYDVDDEYDDDDENTGLVIEGTLGEEMEYKLHEFDIEPSSLWSNPPLDSEIRDQDAECDPRIKYYADRQNEQNIANYQKLLIEQNKASMLQLQAQTTPTSPSAKSEATVPQTTSANTSVTSEPQLVATTNTSEQAQNGTSTNKQPVKQRVADPRLKRNLNNNTSPTGSSSPNQHQLQQQQQQQSDLLTIQTRQVAANSLLSSLPDLQFPKDTAMSGKSYGSQSVQQQQAEPKGVKLSIEDYKRKLNINKPSAASTTNFNNSITSSTMSILNSLASSTSSTNSQAQASEATNSNNSLPSIPSYSVNLQAPQSLHELLRNFQSS